MACKIEEKDIQTFRDRVLNYKFGKLTALPKPVTPNQEFTEKYFTLTNQLLSSSEEGYVFKDTNEVAANKRVSSLINDYYKKKYGNKPIPEGELLSALGTLIHSSAEQLANYYITEYEGSTTSNLSTLKSSLVNAERGYTKDMVEKMDDLVKSTINIIIDTQNKIDSSKKALIRTEQVVIDPTKDMAGTIDLVAQYSDGTAALFDYKTFRPQLGNFIRENGEMIPTKEPLGVDKENAYKLSMSAYASILENQLGIKNFRQVQIIPIMVETTKTGLKGLQTSKSLSEEAGKLLGNVPVYFEYSGDKDRDLAVTKKIALKSAQETRLQKLKPGPEKERVKQLIQELNQSIKDTLQEKNIKNLLDSIRITIAGLSDIKSLDNEELNGNYSDIRALIDILTHERKYILTKLTGDRKERTSAETAYLLQLLKDNQLLIEEEIENRKGELLTSVKVDDREVYNQLGTLALFERTRTLDNPIINAADALISIQYNKAVKKSRQFIEKLQTIDDKVRKEFGNAQEAYNKIQTSKGSLISKISDKFFIDYADQKGDDEWFNNYFELKEEALEKYEDLKKIVKERFENTASNIPDYSAQQQFSYVEKRMQEWEKENSLESIKYNKQKVWKYYRLTNKAYDDYIANEFKSIKGTSLEELYDFLTEANNEASEIFGEYLGQRFIPWIRKTLSDRINVFEPENAKSLWQEFTSIATVREDDTAFGDIDPATGEVRKRIPKFFTNPFRDANGDINYSDKSRDIVKSYMLFFSESVYKYEVLSQIEPQVELLRLSLENANNVQVLDQQGKSLIGKMGEKILKKASLEPNMLNIFDALVKKQMYGINQSSNLFPNHPEASKRLSKLLLTLMDKNAKLRLGLNVPVAAASYIAAEISTAQMVNKLGFDYLKAQKQFHSRSKEVAKFLVELNPYSENRLVKKANESTSNFLNKVFDQRNWFIFFELGEHKLDSIQALIVGNNYGFDDKQRLVQLKKSPEGTKSVYQIMQERELSDIEMLQARNAIKELAKKTKGTMTADETAAYQANLLLKAAMQFKTFMPGVLSERFGRLRYNKGLDYLDMGTHTALLQEFTKEQGRPLMQHLGFYVLPKIAALTADLLVFGKLGISKYRVNQQIAQIKYEQWAEKNPEQAKYTSFDEFLELKRKQIGGSLRELRVIIGLYLTILALGLGDDDDEYYKQNIALRNTYRILNKSLAELSFAFNPSEFTRVLKNPIPVIKLLDDASKTLGNTYDEMRDFIDEENSPRDQSPAFYYTLKWVNGYSGLSKLLEFTEQDQENTYETK